METEFHEGDIIVTNRDKYLAAVICYIHLNPVEARESDDPKDYPWSSHHHYLGHRTARPWLSVGEVLNVSEILQFIEMAAFLMEHVSCRPNGIMEC